MRLIEKSRTTVNAEGFIQVDLPKEVTPGLKSQQHRILKRKLAGFKRRRKKR
jgi:hypothetical protein